MALDELGRVGWAHEAKERPGDVFESPEGHHMCMMITIIGGAHVLLLSRGQSRSIHSWGGEGV